MLFSFDVPQIVESVKIQYNFRHFSRSAQFRWCEGTLHLERLFAVPRIAMGVKIGKKGVRNAGESVLSFW